MMMKRTAVAMIAVSLISTLALAQTTAPTTTVDLGAAWNAFQTWTITLVSVAVSILVGWVLMAVKSKLNISIDDSMRAALQTALLNGAGLILNKMGNQLQGKVIDVRNPFLAEALNMVLQSAPAAIAHFGLTPEMLQQKIIAKIPQIANTTTPPANA